MFAAERPCELELARVDDCLFGLSYPPLARQLSRSSGLIFRGSEYERLTVIVRQALAKLVKGELNHARWRKFEHA